MVVHDTIQRLSGLKMWLRRTQGVSWYLYLQIVFLPSKWMNLQMGLDSLLYLYLSGAHPNLPSKKDGSFTFYLSAWQKAQFVLRQSVLSTSFEFHSSGTNMLTCAVMVQEQRWVKLSVPGHESRPWHQAVREEPALHSHTITGAEEKTTSQPHLGVVIEDD